MVREIPTLWFVVELGMVFAKSTSGAIPEGLKESTKSEAR